MSEPDAKARFRAQLDALVGRPMGSNARALAPDPVNQPMIRHWSAALEDENPAYIDPEFAAASRFGGIVSPPVMLQTWTLPTPQISGIAERGGAPIETADSPLAIFDDAGFKGTVATNSEFQIERYVRLGEVLSSSTVIESISEEKTTALGAGHFVTWVTTYFDEGDEIVGRQRFRVLKFNPGGEGDGPS